jgi:hypothetical protein
MQLDTMTSQAQVREALARAAETAWGAGRLGELQANLDLMAAALWELAQQRLDPLDIEPDFISQAEE